MFYFSNYREAYYWLRTNTKEDATIMSWWDYGYQISGMANRKSIIIFLIFFWNFCGFFFQILWNFFQIFLRFFWNFFEFFFEIFFKLFSILFHFFIMKQRTTLVDNNTWNNSHIAMVGKAMASNEDDAYKIMQDLGVDYVLIIFGGLLGTHRF